MSRAGLLQVFCGFARIGVKGCDGVEVEVEDGLLSVWSVACAEAVATGDCFVSCFFSRQKLARANDFFEEASDKKKQKKKLVNGKEREGTGWSSECGHVKNK